MFHNCNKSISATHSRAQFAFFLSKQTTGLLVFAFYVQIFQIIGPWYGHWSPHALIYAFTTVFALASHFRAQFTDPGAVPKPKPVRLACQQNEIVF